MRQFLPFEDIQCEPHLDGSSGQGRQHHLNPLGFKNDINAACVWLESHRENVNTYRQYRRSLDIIFNWAIFVRNIAISSLSESDFADFDRYLASPQLWDPPYFRSKKIRGAPGWRPITEPLSTSSRGVTLASIKSFAAWLHDTNYASIFMKSLYSPLRVNYATRAAINLKTREIDHFTLNEWRVLRESAETIATTREGARLCAMLDLLYFTDMTVEDLAVIDFSKLSLILDSPGPPAITIKSRKTQRSTVYLMRESCASTSRWFQSEFTNGVNQFELSIGTASQCRKYFTIAKKLAASVTRDRGLEDMAATFESASVRQIRGAFAKHLEKTQCTGDAWMLAGISATKGLICEYLPKRLPLSIAQYETYCSRISTNLNEVR